MGSKVDKPKDRCQEEGHSSPTSSPPQLLWPRPADPGGPASPHPQRQHFFPDLDREAPAQVFSPSAPVTSHPYIFHPPHSLPEIASKLPFSYSQSNRPLLEKLYHSPASMDHSNKLDSIKKLSQWKGRGGYIPQ